MPKAKRVAEQPSLLEPQIKTAPCVPAIRQAVRAWMDSGYKGVTATTQQLLQHWFHNDHRRRNGEPFAWYPFQREAIASLIYLYEVAKVERHRDLLERFATTPDLRLLQYDQFARYCLKMATGSGKTKVMALAIAWQYFNAVLEDSSRYAATTLLLAPNVIVFERLRSDFESGRIFRADPIIPPELEIFWEFDCYMRGDSERAGSQGALYLNNIQQMYEQAEQPNSQEPEIMTLMLGSKPPAKASNSEPFAARLRKRGGNLFVVNDEAHHTHDEENEWNRTIRRLHEPLAAKNQQITMQLDLLATPRYNKGSLFTWTIYDYPLKQAILDNVVKRPLKGIASGIQEVPSDIASIRYQAYLAAGVERWREYRQQLAPLQRKPLLFVMLNSTKDADDVADYLRNKYPADFAGGKLQVIHTDNSGDVSKADLEAARKVAQEIDDAKSPINAIVSVLMLREGWDVQSVTVVVGLRPYSAKANILPEQTIGRGLRLMFRSTFGPNPPFRERVDVIGNKTFIEFVEQLEKDEDLEFETFELGHDKVVIETIFPDPDKQAMDIAVPLLSPLFTRKRTLAEEIAAIEVSAIRTPKLPKKQGDAAAQAFKYEGYDIITLEKLVERQYTLPAVQTAQEVISYYAKRIAADVKLPAQFAGLVPKIREFLGNYAFGESVNLDDPVIIKAIAHPVAQHVTVKAFVTILRRALIEEQTPSLEQEKRWLSSCAGFPWSRPILVSSKTVFNRVAVDNEFELTFARFLHKASDVIRFVKLPKRFNFVISYTDSAANVRYYEPDFIAVTSDSIHHLIETKGREDIDVPHKNRAATLWCENATRLSTIEWRYKIIKQGEFESLQAADFEDLIALEDVGVF